MSNPGTELWNALIALNNQADSLIERVRRAVEPTMPIGREIPATISIETLFQNLPKTYAQSVPVGSDLIAGNNVKRVSFQNGGSRLYIREIGFDSYFIRSIDPTAVGAPDYQARIANQITRFPFNFRWNFQTSITQRWYADKRCLGRTGARVASGTHLAFREPLIVEPMENVVLEVELLGGFQMTASQITLLGSSSSAVVSMTMSGYREGV